MVDRIARLAPGPLPVDGEIVMPGSKSYTNRSLIMAALTDGGTSLLSASPSDDSRLLSEGLRKLGVRIDEHPEGWSVRPPVSLTPYRGAIDLGPAGTAMRFMTALCAGVEGARIELRGSERMHERPIADLVEALRTLGARIDYLGREGCPPLLIEGRGLKGGDVKMRGDVSSQFFSALLLTSPLHRGGLRIEVDGEQISKSYVDMTIDGMRRHGVEALNEGFRRYVVGAGQRYRPGEHAIEGDASGASYFWALAAIAGGGVTVRNIPLDSVQGDAAFPDLLERMGCAVRRGRDGAGEFVRVEKGSAGLSAISADMSSMPDTAQTLAVVASVARGETLLGGLSTLRHKETDRLEAIVTELAKAGIHAEAGDDTLMIRGGSPRPARFATYDDHRMAMSLALFGSILEGVEIEHHSVVNKSFPAFWLELERLGVSCACE